MIKNLLVVVISGVIALHLYNLYNFMEFKKEVKNYGPRNCYNVPGIEDGSEDIVVIDELKVAIVSSGIFARQTGNIYLVKLDNLEALKSQLFSFEPASFDSKDMHPHGMKVRKSSDGRYHLYVINHPKAFDSVDVFEVDANNVKLKHIKRFTDPLFRTLNNLAVVGDDSFYASNFIGDRDNLWHIFKASMLMQPVGDVVFFDGKRARVVLDSMNMPNGLAASPDGKLIYLSVLADKSLNLYRRNADNSLSLVKEYSVGEWPDNISYLDSEIWIGGPARFYDSAMRNAEIDVNRAVPSFVSKMTVEPNGKLSNLQNIFMNDGKLIAGCSVAIRYKNHILMGTVDNKMLVCKL